MFSTFIRSFYAFRAASSINHGYCWIVTNMDGTSTSHEKE